MTAGYFGYQSSALVRCWHFCDLLARLGIRPLRTGKLTCYGDRRDSRP